eukprot:CAMPEP_0194096396 /NCGR_PEP_ID=MMETSP0149-20130528/57322_1 /TAXON_ID=122233 /ORGANISM="Chaetoceros debilis, Strain MM31A-1" /LENGTH=855 /DNA_ID=CAMNT_0038782367 /DNA_START=41 /DNA_END=2606 /DNA_ORIENTATION=+
MVFAPKEDVESIGWNERDTHPMKAAAPIGTKKKEPNSTSKKNKRVRTPPPPSVAAIMSSSSSKKKKRATSSPSPALNLQEKVNKFVKANRNSDEYRDRDASASPSSKTKNMKRPRELVFPPASAAMPMPMPMPPASKESEVDLTPNFQAPPASAAMPMPMPMPPASKESEVDLNSQLPSPSKNGGDSNDTYMHYGPQLPTASKHSHTNNIELTCEDPSLSSSTMVSMSKIPQGVYISQATSASANTNTNNSHSVIVSIQKPYPALAITGRAKIRILEGTVKILGYQLSTSSCTTMSEDITLNSSHEDENDNDKDSNNKKSVLVDSPHWMSCLAIEPIPVFNDNANGNDSTNIISNSKCEVVKLQITSLPLINGNNKGDHKLNKSDDDRNASTSTSKSEPTFEMSSTELTRPISMNGKWRDIATSIVKSLSEDQKEIVLTPKNNSDNDKNSNSTSEQEHAQEEDKMPLNAVLVCGAKGVGKSTYVRYLVNRYLSDNPLKQVAVLDCDLGQPELSPPGMLTLTMLKEPLLSPPHVHMVCKGESEGFDNDGDNLFCGVAQQHVNAYFYGGTTSKINPMAYVSSIKKLVQEYKKICQPTPQSKGESPTIPLIVNTDGYVKGMGFEILSSLINIVNPRHIAQIIGSSKAKFFDLTPHVKLHRTIHIAETSGKSVSLTPPMSRVTSLSSMPSMHSMQDTSMHRSLSSSALDSLSPIPSSLLRDLRLCVYFLGGYQSFLEIGASFDKGGIVDDENRIAMTLSKMCPYAVPFESIDCIILDEDGGLSQPGNHNIYRELNASIVGLCDKSKSYTCHGLGIVRGVDMVRQLLYILTPVKADILCSNVTSAVRGQLQLPIETRYRG